MDVLELRAARAEGLGYEKMVELLRVLVEGVRVALNLRMG